jgi:precorrin-2 dehydrogenase/sirohydrochlorin ferrochelatase
MSLSYPVHLFLDGRRVLVAGAGAVATRKIERLVETGADVHVVAKLASAEVREFARAGRLTLHERAVEERDVAGAFMVLAATDDAAVNAHLGEVARRAGALVSRVDDPGDSDFTVPALARGKVVEATISTFGRAPSASRRLGRELRRWIASGVDRFVNEVADVRIALAGQHDARARLRALGDGDLFDACVRGDEARVHSLVAEALAGTRPLSEGSPT